jgi:hypothetical protein
MKEIKLPIEVQLVVRAKDLPDTCELLSDLQAIVDEWYWSKIPTIPCGFIRKNK